jgi:hypothetical protein
MGVNTPGDQAWKATVDTFGGDANVRRPSMPNRWYL